MVSDGAVVLGTPPLRSPSLQNYPSADATVEAMSRELWGDCFDKKGVNQYGKGRIFNGYSLEEVFAEIGLAPDCALEAKLPVLYNHRSTMGAEIYFVSNQSNEPIEFAPTFRVSDNMRPELWDAKDGSIRALPEYEITAEGVKVPLKLDELGSCFIVFRQNGITTSESKNYPEPTKVEAVDGEWNVAFEGKLSSHDDITL